MNKGVIYYNTGRKCLHRLLNSIYSSQKYYDGPISIISQGEESLEYCKKIADAFDNVDVIDYDYEVPDGKNKAFIEACLVHKSTPYDLTIWLDADTLITGEFADDLWDAAEEHEFAIAQFSNWKSRGNRIAKRIKEWEPYYPEWIDDAINFGPAINCGVFAFRKDSKLMQDWYELALPGRENFIADETCCQLILPQYPHKIMEAKYNCSCKYGDPYNEDTRIIHYHGRKHYRQGSLKKRNRMINASDLWCEVYEEVLEKNIAGVQDWQPMGDRMLKKYLKARLK